MPASESRKAWEHAGGTDSFTYVVHTAGGDTNVATVRITVRPRTVIARDDSFTMVQGTTLSVAAPGVLANDSYPAGSSVEFDTVSGLEKRRRYRGLQLHAGPVVHGHGVVLVHDSPAWRKQPAGYCRHRCDAGDDAADDRQRDAGSVNRHGDDRRDGTIPSSFIL